MKEEIKFKSEKINPFFDNYAILRILCFLFLLTIFNHTLSGQKNCEECQNPLVGLAEMKITGDLETVRNIIEGYMDYEFTGRLPERIAGWDNLLEGKDGHGGRILELDLAARINALNTLRLKNPCAKLILTYRKVGAAKKYRIESTAEIKIGNGQVEVEHVSDTGIEKLSVPRIGTINIKHELIALKNGQIYDTGEEVIDWVPPPPPPSDIYRETQGIIMPGYFDTHLLHGQEISLSHGDIGITIRKKETPSSCSVDVDDISKFPPHYKLKINDIQNQFNERMPNNVKIALKAELGKIISGEERNGWRVFNTINGQISDEILYRPPSCAEAKVDILKVAGICDYHDGTPSVGKPRFDLKVTNSRCYDAVVTMTGINTEKKRYDKSTDPACIEFKEIKTYDREIKATITIGMELQSGIEMRLWNQYWEYYIEKSRDINSFSDNTNDYWYRYCQGKFSSWYNERTGIEEGKKEKFGIPLPIQVILVYDLPKKEPQRVMIGGVFINYKIDIVTNHISWVDGLTETTEDSEVRLNQSFWISPVEENSNASDSPSLKYHDFVIKSGDGKDSFKGEGKIEQIKRGDECYQYDECREKKIFRWHFRRFKQGK